MFSNWNYTFIFSYVIIKQFNNMPYPNGMAFCLYYESAYFRYLKREKFLETFIDVRCFISFNMTQTLPSCHSERSEESYVLFV